MASKVKIERIFVACGFTWNNKGDAALLTATAQALRGELPGIDLGFSSFTPELDSQRYGERVVRMPIDPAGRPAKAMRKFGFASPIALRGFLGLLLGLFRVWLLLHRFSPSLVTTAALGRFGPTTNEILRSDLVVALPGGYLQATNWRDDYWLFHWLTLGMALAADKPVMIYAQSVGPFVGLHRSWARSMLRRISVISVREEFSLARLVGLGLDRNDILVVPDAAFGLTSSGVQDPVLSSAISELQRFPGPWIGVSVREHHFPGAATPDLLMERYLSEVAGAADRIIESTGGSAIFVPQCIGSGGRDPEISRAVVSRMRHPTKALVIEDDLSPQALQFVYGKFEMLVGTRMHANILAMTAGTPVAAIAYERKTNGIMRMLGLEEDVINIDDLQGRLGDFVESVYLRRGAIRNELATAIPKVRNLARNTPRRLFEKCGIATP